MEGEGNAFMMRIGGADDGNFDRSVLKRIKNGEIPIWGYLSDSFCNVNETIVSSIQNKTFYIFFIENGKKGIIGVAEDSNIKKRDLKKDNLIDLSTNDVENGWVDKTGKSFDYEIEFKRYWNLEKYNSDFNYAILKRENDGDRISQSTYHRISESLASYIYPKIKSIINTRKPDYDVTRP